jgi:hypothetical protein
LHAQGHSETSPALILSLALVSFGTWLTCVFPWCSSLQGFTHCLPRVVPRFTMNVVKTQAVVFGSSLIFRVPLSCRGMRSEDVKSFMYLWARVPSEWTAQNDECATVQHNNCFIMGRPNGRLPAHPDLHDPSPEHDPSVSA